MRSNRIMPDVLAHDDSTATRSATLAGMSAEPSAIHTRIVVLGLAISGLCLLFACRLLQLQVIEGSHYAQVVDQSRVVTEILQPRRGRILDRSGTAIADTRLVYSAAVVFADLEVPPRMRRSYTLWQLDEHRLGELLADLTGRIRLPAGTSLRELVVRELIDHPAVAVRSGPRRGDDQLGLLVLPKDALNPYRAEGDSTEIATLAEGELLSEDPLVALEREVRSRWDLPCTVLTEAVFAAVADSLEREFQLPGPESARDLLDPFAPPFTVAVPSGGSAGATSQPPPSTVLHLRLVIADQQAQAEQAFARVVDREPRLVHERLQRAIAEARQARAAQPSPLYFAAASAADQIAPRLPRGTMLHQVALTGVPGARERILLVQGDPPDGEGLYTQLTRRVAANLGLDPLTFQALIERHAKPQTVRQAEQNFRARLLVLDYRRLERLADGLTTELSRAGKLVNRLEVDRLLAKARRAADKEWAGQTRRDPIALFEDIPQSFAIRFAGRDSEPPLELLKRYDDAGAELPGLAVTTVTGRAYPFGATLCHTLGTVGIDPSDRGGPPGGRWGLEALYDQRLRGLPGSRVHIRTPDGVRVAANDPPLAGLDLTTEIDLEVQTIAEDSLEHDFELAQALGSATSRMEAAQKVGLGRGGFVLLDCQTGGILALASNPRFTYEQLAADYGKMLVDPAEPLLDHAAVPSQPPGSSFKILTALACLEYGVINPGEELFCKGYMTMYQGKKVLRDHAPPGNYNLIEAIQMSSNVYFATIGAKLGAERLFEIGDKLGLGRNCALDVTQQRPGILPNPGRIAALRPREPHWVPNDTWRMAIGQFATASPLQCAAIAAAVANGGHIVRPFLVRPTTEPEAKDLRIRKEWLADVREGMERVTANLDHSTAKLLVLQGKAAGIKVAAKTGTAEWGSAAQREAGLRPDHAWMIGYAPADNPTVAFACFIYAGTFGGQACTPVVKRVLETYFSKYGRGGHAAENGVP
jgi:penicillin-binding protein 2